MNARVDSRVWFEIDHVSLPSARILAATTFHPGELVVENPGFRRMRAPGGYGCRLGLVVGVSRMSDNKLNDRYDIVWSLGP